MVLPFYAFFQSLDKEKTLYPIICSIYSPIYIWNSHVQRFTILFIIIDRFICSSSYEFVVLGIINLLTMIVALIPFSKYHLFKQTSCYYNYFYSYGIFSMVYSFAIPFLIIFILSIFILSKLFQYKLSQNSNIRNKLIVTSRSMIVVLVFLLCHGPLCFYLIIEKSKPQSPDTESSEKFFAATVLQCLRCVLFCSSIITPFCFIKNISNIFNVTIIKQSIKSCSEMINKRFKIQSNN